jgi:hypothetical protein
MSPVFWRSLTGLFLAVCVASTAASAYEAGQSSAAEPEPTAAPTTTVSLIPLVVLSGAVPTEDDLPPVSSAGEGELWIVSETGHGWTALEGVWTDVGQLRGEKGEAGEAGEEGPVGEQGPQGLAGANGENGAIGSIGPAGPVGPVGASGPRGFIGPQGEQGEIGAQGPPGSQGPIGPQGEVGAQGEQGTPGEIGIQGPQGSQGVQGEIGPPGPMCPEGFTAQTIGVHQREPGDDTVTVLVCVAS